MVMHARRKNSPPTRLAFSPLRRATLPALTSLAGEGWSVRINREIQAVAPSWAARAGLGRWFVFGINRGIQALPVYDVGRPRRITGKRILAPLHRRKGRIQFRLRLRRHRFHAPNSAKFGISNDLQAPGALRPRAREGFRRGACSRGAVQHRLCVAATVISPSGIVISLPFLGLALLSTALVFSLLFTSTPSFYIAVRRV